MESDRGWTRILLDEAGNERIASSAACKDSVLMAILMHNRDEEKQHASMLLERIRRKAPEFFSHLKQVLFTETPIAHD